ncbi:hypothetical protein C1645_876918 [Glomus cerebriforme]|uniref:Uncharacterized protein n=1 Tax=Glomus cerebriforme TaxID=658196 RepID=A0A397SSQ4_9GLOM|nr:hypothetical protein C1645_876918 [Glomus cerebriforme]
MLTNYFNSYQSGICLIEQHSTCVYYTGKHKKEQFKRIKLEAYVKTFEHFVTQSWTSQDCLFLIYLNCVIISESTLNFIWKIPDSISEQDKNQEAQMLILANEMVPIYFTRQMRKNVTEKYSLVAKLTPSVWKLLYHDLTEDNSTPPYELSKEMQDDIRPTGYSPTIFMYLNQIIELFKLSRLDQGYNP